MTDLINTKKLINHLTRKTNLIWFKKKYFDVYDDQYKELFVFNFWKLKHFILQNHEKAEYNGRKKKRKEKLEQLNGVLSMNLLSY